MIYLLKAKYQWEPLVKGIVPDSQIYDVILKNRGIDDPDHFFSMGKEMLHDPFLLDGMEHAVNRIKKAISNNEKIVIYGDYDCDGISSISVLYRALKKCHATVSYSLPDRFVDGYGLNMKAAQKMIDSGMNLVITVDNGITCVNEVALLKQAGVDTIITDHHEVKEVIPDAFEIIHPKVSKNYPFKEIAGVMVAYKLASALCNDSLDELMDLVMIGTIADLMPLDDENQAMVNLGLLQLEKTTNIGLKKLLEYSHLDLINETAIAFKIAPKINSSGRMGKAMEAVKLLVSDSEKEVNDLILQIEENHANRKDLTEEAFLLCEKLVNPSDDVLVIASPFLYEGVIGICAQKIAEKYQKSTCVITLDDEGIGKGSMRSFGGDNILTMLEKNKNYLIKFGGHSQAAGLQILKENIDLLRSGFQACTSNSEKMLLKIDMEISLSEVKVETVKKIQDNSFFTALFLYKDLKVVKKQKLADKHTKLLLESKGIVFEALNFNSLEYYYQLEPEDIIDVVGGLNINVWRKRQTIQIMMKDIRCNDFQVLDFRNPLDYQEGMNWVKTPSMALSDESVLEHNFKKLFLTQKPNRLIILPRKYELMINESIQKETYIKVYRAFPDNQTFTLFDLEKKTKLPLWTLKKALDIFHELELIKKQNDGWIKDDPSKKKELFTSVTYQSCRTIQRFVEWLYQDTIPNIKKTIEAWTEASYEI